MATDYHLYHLRSSLTAISLFVTLLFILPLATLFVSSRFAPVSISYLAFAIAIGFVVGAIGTPLRKRPSSQQTLFSWPLFLVIMVVTFAHALFKDYFFSRATYDLFVWWFCAQFMSMVVFGAGSYLVLMVTVNRIFLMFRKPKHDL